MMQKMLTVAVVAALGNLGSLDSGVAPVAALQMKPKILPDFKSESQKILKEVNEYSKEVKEEAKKMISYMRGFDRTKAQKQYNGYVKFVIEGQVMKKLTQQYYKLIRTTWFKIVKWMDMNAENARLAGGSGIANLAESIDFLLKKCPGLFEYSEYKADLVRRVELEKAAKQYKIVYDYWKCKTHEHGRKVLQHDYFAAYPDLPEFLEKNRVPQKSKMQDTDMSLKDQRRVLEEKFEAMQKKRAKMMQDRKAEEDNALVAKKMAVEAELKRAQSALQKKERKIKKDKNLKVIQKQKKQQEKMAKKAKTGGKLSFHSGMLLKHYTSIRNERAWLKGEFVRMTKLLREAKKQDFKIGARASYAKMNLKWLRGESIRLLKEEESNFPFKENLDKMTSIGFDAETAKAALIKTFGDLAEAIDYAKNNKVERL